MEICTVGSVRGESVGAATIDLKRARSWKRRIRPRKIYSTPGSPLFGEMPGFGVDSAQQVMAEVGVKASTFPSAAEFTSWVGTCPGKDESAEENHSSRSAKGTKYLRRVLSQAAQLR